MFYIKKGYWKEDIKSTKGDLDLDSLVRRLNLVSTPGAFSGVFSLYNSAGSFWNDLTQTDDIVFSEGSSSRTGGSDQIKITANGDAITVPGSWINVGTDSIDITPGAINRIMVLKTISEIHYIVKVA